MNATSHGLTAKTLILQNQAEFLEMLNAHFALLQPAALIRRQKGGNILNKIPVLQNESKDLHLSALNTTPDPTEISTEPKELTRFPRIRRQEFTMKCSPCLPALVGQALSPVILPENRIFVIAARP